MQSVDSEADRVKIDIRSVLPPYIQHSSAWQSLVGSVKVFLHPAARLGPRGSCDH